MLLYYLLFCFLATVCFAIVFNVPRSEFLTCGFVGTISWFVSFVFRDGGSLFLGIFLAACCVTLLSRVFARLRRSPLNLYLVPGIIPLVPGGAIYNTMYAVITGEQTSAVLIGINTLQTAGSICLGILTIFALPGWLFDEVKKLPKISARL